MKKMILALVLFGSMLAARAAEGDWDIPPFAHKPTYQVYTEAYVALDYPVDSYALADIAYWTPYEYLIGEPGYLGQQSLFDWLADVPGIYLPSDQIQWIGITDLGIINCTFNGSGKVVGFNVWYYFSYQKK